MIRALFMGLLRSIKGSNSNHIGSSSMTVRAGGNATVSINGSTYRGASVVVFNGQVFVDGVAQDRALKGQMIKVVVNGSPESVHTDSGDIEVHGTAGAVSTTSGDVKCGNVQGGVSTTSGDVSCRSVGGSVSTVSGDIARSLL